jgi:hypothetical protein
MNEQVKTLMKAIIQMDTAITMKEKEIQGYSDKLDTLTKEVEDISIQLKGNIYDLQKKLAQ